ncbi:retrovirus-related pol polyprotein from transposon TNT 1-94 [Tanacetum coccineum]
MILSGADNRPPMLDKDLYDSWKSRMELYMQNREHGRMIVESIENGPLIWPTIEENGVTRIKKYAELSAAEKIQERECKLYDAFDKVTQIKREPLHKYYLRFTQLINDMNIYNMKMEQFQVNTKFLKSLPPEWNDLIACLNKAMAFLTDVASSRFPSTNNQLRASLNPRNHATNQDGMVTMQQVQGRQGQSYSSTGFGQEGVILIFLWCFFDIALLRNKVKVLVRDCCDKDGDFLCMGSAISRNGTLILTPRKDEQQANMTNSPFNLVGRVLYKTSVIAWPTSFSTTFTIRIENPDYNVYGDGMAFVFAQDDQPSPSQSGVLRQLAVELDTYKNEYKSDPDGNHIAIDTVSTQDPVIVKSLESTGIDLKSGKDITVQIRYDGWKKVLQISVAYTGEPCWNLTIKLTNLTLTSTQRIDLV